MAHRGSYICIILCYLRKNFKHNVLYESENLEVNKRVHSFSVAPLK